ncbi:MAG: hypothetical protein DCC55_29185 [Chloroflexi bacterium]|nr:MAG: hypothetical protein DCC55_29185 [Chloroflexota bacterium]
MGFDIWTRTDNWQRLMMAVLVGALWVALGDIIWAGHLAQTVPLIHNSGFEEEDFMHWQALGAPVLDDEIRHAGSWAVRMGERERAEDCVTQLVAIPAETTGMRLEFWLKLETSEVNPGYDRFYVGLWNTATADPPYLLHEWDLARTGALDWSGQTLTLPESQVHAARGQTVSLELCVQMSAPRPSRAWIDDVQLLATLEGAPPAMIYLPFINGPEVR